MRTAPLMLALVVGMSMSSWSALAQEEPKIKVYGNKTPTMIGTPDEIAKYRQELNAQERLNDAQVTYSYVDENGNTVTVQSSKDNNYGGGFYYDGYLYYGNNAHYNGNVAYPPPPPHGAPTGPNVATGPDGTPLLPPDGLPTPTLPPVHQGPGPGQGHVVLPPPPPHGAPTGPNVATGPDGTPLVPPGGLPTPAVPK